MNLLIGFACCIISVPIAIARWMVLVAKTTL
jgi:hypothetical protein